MYMDSSDSRIDDRRSQFPVYQKQPNRAVDDLDGVLCRPDGESARVGKRKKKMTQSQILVLTHRLEQKRKLRIDARC